MICISMKYSILLAIPFALTGNKQMPELEEKCAAVVDELQKRFSCPRCHQDYTEELRQILQISDES